LLGRPPSEGRWAWLADLFEGLCSTLYNAGPAAVLIAYFVIVVVGCATVLWLRRSQTAIYNVHPDVFDEVLAAVLDAAGLTWSRAGRRYFIARPAERPPAAQ